MTCIYNGTMTKAAKKSAPAPATSRALGPPEPDEDQMLTPDEVVPALPPVEDFEEPYVETARHDD